MARAGNSISARFTRWKQNQQSQYLEGRTSGAYLYTFATTINNQLPIILSSAFFFSPAVAGLIDFVYVLCNVIYLPFWQGDGLLTYI